jgi:hypothetical protein
MSVYQLENNRYIVNFPTKDHWRNPSQLTFVEQGLVGLRRTIDEYGIKSIAIPPSAADSVA